MCEIHFYTCKCAYKPVRQRLHTKQLKFDILVQEETKTKPNWNLRSIPKLDNDKHKFIIDQQIHYLCPLGIQFHAMDYRLTFEPELTSIYVFDATTMLAAAPSLIFIYFTV